MNRSQEPCQFWICWRIRGLFMPYSNYIPKIPLKTAMYMELPNRETLTAWKILLKFDRAAEIGVSILDPDEARGAFIYWEDYAAKVVRALARLQCLEGVAKHLMHL